MPSSAIGSVLESMLGSVLENVLGAVLGSVLGAGLGSVLGVCVYVILILYPLYLEYDKIHFPPILRGVTLMCPPGPPLGQMYHPFLLPPITSQINWPPFLEYNLHIPSSDDNHSKNPHSRSVQVLFDVIAVEYPNRQSRVKQVIWRSRRETP